MIIDLKKLREIAEYCRDEGHTPVAFSPATALELLDMLDELIADRNRALLAKPYPA